METDESSRKSVENEWSGSKAGFQARPLIFYSFSTTFICFHLLTFISNHFHSSLLIFPISLVFDCLYLFLTVFTQIWELPLIFTFFFVYFHSFSAIFDCFQSLFNILTHISSPLTIMTHFQLPLLNFKPFSAIYSYFDPS